MSSELPRRTRRTVLKSLTLGTAACLLEDWTDGAAAAPMAGRGSKLPRTAPEALGISPASLLAFIDAVEKKVGGLHSFMLLRHGQVAAEGWWAPYAPQHPHMLYSLSKSFTSTAVGLAIQEGHLKLEDTVLSFFPDAAPAEKSENLQAMRVQHLLMMSTGHDKDATGPTVAAPNGDWVRGFLSLPVEHAPGSKFVYNSAATYMLSAIVQKRTGLTVRDYLQSRLFGPLGIEGATWETCPKGINTGGWGLNIKTEDIARFGQMYLQKGKWEGRSLVPEAWVAEATTKHISNGDPAAASDWSQGYGYQFWRCRNGAFRGDGAFGQYCVVMPEQEAVLAITSGVGDMQAVLNALWEHLLPGMGSAALPPAAPGAPSDLRKKIAALEVPAPEGKAASPNAQRVSGKMYRIEPNDEKIQSATLTFKGKRGVLTLADARGERTLAGGQGSWVKGVAPLTPDRPNSKVAAQGAWTDDDTYTFTVCHYETPYVETVVCKFAEDSLTINRKLNVGFGPTQRPLLTGRSTG